MTTATKSRRPKVTPSFTYHVMSRDDDTVYFAIDEHPGGVLIRRLPKSGGKQLNPFWEVWLREELWKAEASRMLTVKIIADGVRVTSPLPVTDWLWTVGDLAANVVPLKSPPIWTSNGRGREDARCWSVRAWADLTTIVDNLELPDELARSYRVSGGLGTVYLNRRERGSCSRIYPIAHARLLVEQRIALACTQNGVPLNQDWGPGPESPGGTWNRQLNTLYR
jgi:hypothetical protein